jgi:hypothetical protein
VAELIKFEFVINLKRPRALGLALNLLITAAEVIDNDTFALQESAIGPCRTSRDVRHESEMRTVTDISAATRRGNPKRPLSIVRQ